VFGAPWYFGIGYYHTQLMLAKSKPNNSSEETMECKKCEFSNSLSTESVLEYTLLTNLVFLTPCSGTWLYPL